jgi:Nucleotidyltransferase
VDELYARSRLSLLDALEALSEHRDGVILIGAHAVYMYTGEADVPIATRTKDSDLALDPALLRTDPLLEEAMADAGFQRNLESGQPGEWLSANGVPVDLLVPSSLVDPRGRRGARIPPHSSQAARKVSGLEAAVVDNREFWIEALDADDPRRILTKVAGPAALTVSKAFKLGERQAAPRRLENKDAHDVYRLLRAVETQELVEGFTALRSDSRSAHVAHQAIEYLSQLFDDPSSIGSRMAGEAEKGIGDPEIVAASVAALVADLREGIVLKAD